MKRFIAVITLIAILAFAISVLAQDPPTGLRQGQRQGTFVRIDVLNKDSLANYLVLTAAQKRTVFAEVDSLAKIYGPFQKEDAALRKKLGLPEQLGMGIGGGRGIGGGGGGGIGNISMETFQQYNTERTALMKKYEPKEPSLKAHLANIEKVLTEEQKTKWNARGVTKPTFVPFQRGGGF